MRLNNKLLLDVGQATHAGMKRNKNEDYFGWFSTPLGELFIVADGMGGHNGGAIASECAVKSFYKYFNQRTGEPSELLSGALAFAEKAVIELGKSNSLYYGCGTTIVVLLISNNFAWFLHAGDSRLYIFSEGRLNQVGRDHSAVEDMLEAGLISQKEAINYPKNIITQSLGGNINYKRCLPQKFSFNSGDKFLLCTDGLWGVINRDILSKTLKSEDTSMNICKKLINLTLENGAPDNVSVQLIKIIAK